MATSSNAAIVRICSFVLMMVMLHGPQKVQSEDCLPRQYEMACTTTKMPNPTTLPEVHVTTDDFNATAPLTSTPSMISVVTTSVSENTSTVNPNQTTHMTSSSPMPNCCGNCSNTCGNCSGPTKNDCLSCLEGYDLSFNKCDRKSESTKPPIPLIAGIAGGGVLFVTLVIIVCCCALRRHKKPPKPIVRDFSLGGNATEFESQHLDSEFNLHDARDKTGLVNQAVDDELYGNVDSHGNIIMSENPDDIADSSFTNSPPSRPMLPPPTEAAQDFGGIYVNTLIGPATSEPKSEDQAEPQIMYTNTDEVQPRQPSHPKMPAIPQKHKGQSLPSRPWETKQPTSAFEHDDSAHPRKPFVHQVSDDLPTLSPPPPPVTPKPSPGKKPSLTTEQTRNLPRPGKLPVIPSKRSFPKKMLPATPTKAKVARHIDNESDLRGDVQLGNPVSPTQRPSFTPSITDDFGGNYEVAYQQQSDYGMNYEVADPHQPTRVSSTPDHGEAYEYVQPQDTSPTEDYGGTYEAVEIQAGTDYGGTYEAVENPVKPHNIDMSRRAPVPTPKQVPGIPQFPHKKQPKLSEKPRNMPRITIPQEEPDFGGEYTNMPAPGGPKSQNLPSRVAPPIPGKIIQKKEESLYDKAQGADPSAVERFQDEEKSELYENNAVGRYRNVSEKVTGVPLQGGSYIKFKK